MAAGWVNGHSASTSSGNGTAKKSPSRRGILPKAATEQMKDWLFKHIGVSSRVNLGDFSVWGDSWTSLGYLRLGNLAF